MSKLSEKSVKADPIAQFALWFEEMLKHPSPEPYAVVLATATREGRPSARMVLLKNVDHRGFEFYTNYHSRKGRELAENPHGALLFYWGELRRQVRVEGPVEKLSPEESDAYFATRPFENQVSAWTSQQSRVIESREVLEKRFQELVEQYRGKPVPRPPHWGGYRLRPLQIEFWQGQPNRLHDRIRYTRTDTGWKIERLAP